MTYFAYFPLVSWNNTIAVDITTRGAVVAGKGTDNDPRVHTPLTVPERIRPDTVASAYYQSDDFTWLVYLSAEVIDPWFEWYLSPEQLDSFIEKKYGSVEIAQAKTHHWQLAWGGRTEERITSAAYDALLDDHKKYYEPLYGRGADIFNYRLRRDDWTMATNKFINIVHTATNNSFSEGEVVTFTSGLETVGSVVVERVINSTSFDAKHVNGTPNAVALGMESNVTATFVSSSVLLNVIPEGEEVFWEPVSCYDVEIAKNESRRTINLVDSRWAEQAKQDLIQLMQTINTE